MANTRRTLLTGGLALGALAATGCTEMLWKDGSTWYNETLDSVLLSADNKTLVFISPKYHYIFEAPPELVGTLHAPELHAKVKGEMGAFHVNRHGVISGSYTLIYNGSDPEMIAQAKALGYREARGVWEFYGKIVGRRYDANGIKLTEGKNSPTKLSKAYHIEINEDESGMAVAGKVLVTPVTVAADGALIIGGIALAPIALIFFFALMFSAGGLPIPVGP